MKSLTEKIFLKLDKPCEDDISGDKERIIKKLEETYENVYMPYEILKNIYPMCRKSDFEITVTLLKRESDWVITRIEKADTSQFHYGLCVDLGSTTISMQLIDLNSGDVLAKETTFNLQIKYGDDILTRIFKTKGHLEILEEIQKSTVESFNILLKEIERKTNIDSKKCDIMVVAGNTTMTHFLLGLDAWPVFEVPYAPVFNDCSFIKAQELNIDIGGYIYCFPSVSNYLGGDIVSGLLATKIYNKDEMSVFLDIGTNGELVIGNNQFLVAGAGAAGPALEGGISKFGMKASSGAIDTVKIVNNEIKYTTIENNKPIGICGSGIVDLISELFINGWIDFLGQIIHNDPNYVTKVENQNAIRYVSSKNSGIDEDLVFTQNDINEFLTTKSAANTMVAYLLDEVGLDLSLIDKFYVAGAFGTYMNLESAITIGMYPDLHRDKFAMPGNTSLNGTYELIVNRDLLKEVEYIKNNIQYIQFSNAMDFIEKMRAAKFIPHTNLELYPTVKEKLKQKEILNV